MKYTTLNKIRAHSPCEYGWKKLLTHLGKTQADDEPLSFVTILESNGLDDTLWCCCAAPEYDREWRLFAVWCALQVKHLMTDKRSLNALVVAEAFANGLATQVELDAAGAVARAVAWDATRDAARAAVRDTARAAWAAARAVAWAVTWDTAWNSAWDTARDAAKAVAWDAERAAAKAAERDAAWDAAWAAARDAQEKSFLWVVNGGLTAFESEAAMIEQRKER
jgi:hypothetical protein